jgi:hypothetical protein
LDLALDFTGNGYLGAFKGLDCLSRQRLDPGVGILKHLSMGRDILRRVLQERLHGLNFNPCSLRNYYSRAAEVVSI